MHNSFPHFQMNGEAIVKTFLSYSVQGAFMKEHFPCPSDEVLKASRKVGFVMTYCGQNAGVGPFITINYHDYLFLCCIFEIQP